MKTKTIACLARTQNLQEAIKAHLVDAHPGAKFVLVSKTTDVPEPNEETGEVLLASIGIPTYLSPSSKSGIISINGPYDPDQEKRDEMWEKLRSPDTPVEDLVPLLGANEAYLVIPSRAAVRAKMEYADLRITLAETDAEDLETRNQILRQMVDVAQSVSAI